MLIVLVLVLRNYIHNIRHPPPAKWRLLRTHVDAYLLSLLLSDFLQGLGAIFTIKWTLDKRVSCSPLCITQGAVQQIGEAGVAMATLAIAVHTFVVIFFRWSPRSEQDWIYRVVIAFIWIYVTIFAIVGYAVHHSSNSTTPDSFFTPTPYWCWISSAFLAERIMGEYLWLWLAAFTSIILYSLLFFRLRGNIWVDPMDWRKFHWKWRVYRQSDDYGNESLSGAPDPGRVAAKESMAMIWYPISYTILVLPLSIVRWSTFRPMGMFFTFILVLS